METATFSLWYKSKKRAALQELNKRYVREYCDCDLVKILEGKRDMVRIRFLLPSLLWTFLLPQVYYKYKINIKFIYLLLQKHFRR